MESDRLVGAGADDSDIHRWSSADLLEKAITPVMELFCAWLDTVIWGN
jgi:hypothetical protein